MASFEPIKFSELPNTPLLARDDLLMVEKIDDTNAVRVGNLIDLFVQTDINFTGNVTFSGTIMPDIISTLDGVFDSLTITNNIELPENIDKLFLKFDFEDVKTFSIIDNQLLEYRYDAKTERSFFTNVQIGEDYVEPSPEEDGVYARKEGLWVDIEPCIRCPGDAENIGNATVTRINNDPLLYNLPHFFRVDISGSPEDVQYQWSVTPDADITVLDPERIKVDFDKPGQYAVSVVIDDLFARDAPKSRAYTLYLYKSLSPLTITSDTDVVSVNDSVSFEAISDTYESDVNYNWSVLPSTADITITGFNKSTIQFSESGEYFVRCVVSSTEVLTDPIVDTYKVTVNL